MNKILIIDDLHPNIVPMLKSIGYDVDYEPTITEKEVYNRIENYTGLLLRSKMFIGVEILSKATKLKFIARAGAGIDQIVEEEVLSRGIKLLNAPEGNRDAVAEHVLGMILTLFNNIHIGNTQVKNGLWLREENRGHELNGKTVGIIGYGNNGKAFAKLLKGFNCQVLAYDILHRQNYEDENSKAAEMEDIFEHADIVSFHTSLTNETDELVNNQYISKFKKNIWLFNLSRGKIVVLKDLLDNIDSGKIKGAGLDVLTNENLKTFKEKEPNIYARLMASDKIILTPHVGGWTFESHAKINEVLFDKIKALQL
ncbi:MAG: NAD(P)-dependent oxidoreductase [Cytophagales bacterium]